jgi:hypothetical protein
MSLQKIADGTVKKLTRSIPGLDFSDAQRDELKEMIAAALAETVEESAAIYRESTVMCCGAESDLAHTINADAEKRTQLLISSLSHMR